MRFISHRPGQTGADNPVILSGGAVCNSIDPQLASISIAGVGGGTMSLTKVK